MRRSAWFALAVLALATQLPAVGQVLPQRGTERKSFVSYPEGHYALLNVRLFDATGTPAREGQTIIVDGKRIVAVGPSSEVPVPPDATRIDVAGKTVLPGLVDMHAHLHYAVDTPEPSAKLRHQGPLVPRLLLASGVTTARTGGTIDPLQDLAIGRAIREGTIVGPDLDITAVFIDQAPTRLFGSREVATADRARMEVAYWAGAGATSVKLFTNVGTEIAKATIDEAHRRGMNVAGHLCALTFKEAAALGIDSLEHGFQVATDFMADKKADECPKAFNIVPEQDAPGVADHVRALARSGVALTLSPGAFEVFYPAAQPLDPLTRELLSPRALASYAAYRAGVAERAARDERWRVSYTAKGKRSWALDRLFAQSGGLVLMGTDTTPVGGCVAGPCTHRTLELLVDMGFTPSEVLTIATRNGARFLRKEKDIGGLAPGMLADLVIVHGRPDTDIADMRRTEIVFKHGVGYSAANLLASVNGLIGE